MSCGSVIFAIARHEVAEVDRRHENAVFAASGTGKNDYPASKQLHQACRLARDLFRPKPLIYWTDMLVCWAIGMAALIVAIRSDIGSASFAAAFVVAVLVWYRASLFIHEIAHQPPRALPGFRAAWNVLIGTPLLLPSIMYEGTHPCHHRRDTYGTPQDPEYQYLNGRRLWVALSLAGGLFAPWILVVRFLVLGPIALLVPPLHRVLEAMASAYAINPLYRRTMTAKERRSLRWAEVLLPAAWGVALLLAWQDVLPWRAFAVWLAVYMVLSFLNHTRMLAAHRFDSHWQPTDQVGQFLDSIDTPGGLWSELWAPLGLRYHALHHLLPTIPYHNLGRGYRRLVRELPRQSVYHAATSPSLKRSLQELWTGKA